MELVDKMEEFSRSRYEAEVYRAAKEEKALVIDFSMLDRFDPVTADMLLEAPDVVLASLRSAAERVAAAPVTVRVRNLPESRTVRIRDLRAKHLGKLWTLDTTIRSASEVKPQIYEATFRCPECDALIAVEQDSNMIKKPMQCDCGRRGDFPLEAKKLMDVRWLTGTDPFEVIEGERPGDVAVFLKHDLTAPNMQRKSDPGARLRIVGVLRELPKRIRGKLSTKMDMYLEALHFEPSEVEFEELEITHEDERIIQELAANPDAYDMLRNSIAPDIYGYEEIKEAILLQLFGGVVHRLPNGSRIRGNLHILLTGDPSTGKTALMKLVTSIAPRARYVSGTGASGAGMCTTYDTTIVLGNGEIKKIGDLVEENAKNMKEVEDGVFVQDCNELDIMALDQKDLKIKPMKITKYWKIRSPKNLIKITTRMGKTIRVTEDNPIPVIEDGELMWKTAKNIATGDYVATPRILKIFEEGNTATIFDKTARLVNCKETVSVMLDEIRKSGTIKEFIEETGVSRQGLYWWWKTGNSAPTIETLETIGGKIGIDVQDALPEEMTLTQQRGNFLKLPKNLNEEIMYFFGLIAGDGDIAKTKYGGMSLRFHSSSEELLKKFSSICKKNFVLEPEFYKRPERIAYMRINSKILGKLAALFGIPHGKKSSILNVTQYLSRLPDNLIAAYLRGLFDTDGYVCERRTKGSNSVGFTSVSREFAYGINLLLLRFGIISRIRERDPTVSEIRGKKVVSSKSYEVEIKDLKNIRLFRDSIGFGFTSKKEVLERVLGKLRKSNTNVDIVPNVSGLLRDARLSCKMTAKELYGYKSYEYEKNRVKPSRDFLAGIVGKLNGNNETIKKLDILSNSDVFWDEIKSVETVEGEDYVYDLTVEEEHSFVANGMIIHNTATVTKNEVIGSWVLEAGALILANKSVIGIDEFDKISRDDQVALHEAMSVETISIAKASIVATLPAQTAVLAGANPKLGRFDPYRPIAEQLNIPETLLSRFDVKFALRDVPDKAKDERLADHIIESRMRPESVTPAIDVAMLRKYIAYAKQRVQSIELTEESAKMLKDFYIDMRTRSATGETSAVAITLRQYEALHRLAEASAKIRLDTKMRKEDALRAIRLMQYSMSQLGYDYETGRYDVDRLEGGVAASKRERINKILDIIASLQKEMKEIAIADVHAAAENQGIAGVDEIIEHLKREGAIFEPRPGFVRKI